jgi:GNAT superfamily N-acetyltransferase
MKTINSSTKDTEAIFKLYDEAIAFQKTKFTQHWQGFDLKMVQKEIEENRQWKLIDDDDNILCIFATNYNDPFIWEEKDNEPSIYLHRIVTNPIFRGKNNMAEIIKWAKDFGIKNEKKFIRMDTWGENKKLMAYYIKCGFTFVGIVKPKKTEGLPSHYSTTILGLFEMAITKNQ